jgi:hypothetical protein
MASTPHDGPGTSFTFNGTKYTITNLVYNLTDPAGGGDQIDVSHLGLTTGASLLFMDRPLKGATGGETGKEVTIDYIGSAAIAGGTSAAYSITGGLSLSGNATCVSSSVTLALNEVIRGNATFRVA